MRAELKESLSEKRGESKREGKKVRKKDRKEDGNLPKRVTDKKQGAGLTLTTSAMWKLRGKRC